MKPCFSLEELAYDAYADEEIHGEAVYEAIESLKFRGFSEDEIFHFVTWGDM